MTRKSMLLGAALLAGASFGFFAPASAGPVSAGAPSASHEALNAANGTSDMIIQTQGRRGGGMRAGVGRRGAAFGARGVGRRGFRGRRGWRGDGGIDAGAAIGIGAAAAILGAAGAAAAANADPGYAECYWVRRPVYDQWGNYLGRRRTRVCN